MRPARALLTAAFALVAMSGCASAPAAVPTPTPTPESATPEQVASIIAEYEADWREVVENATMCRLHWVMGETALDEAEGVVCYMREQTIVITAELVLRDLATVVVPDSMSELVDETTQALSAVAAVPLTAACGEEFEVPDLDDEDCSEAAGDLLFAYDFLLDSVLEKWRPYL